MITRSTTRPIFLTGLCWLALAAGAQAQGLGVSVGGDLSVSVGGETSGGDSSVSVGVDTGGGTDIAPDAGAIPGAATEPLEQEVALEAVRAHRALPLDQILAAARLLTDGEVIDARLVSLNGFLLYELTVLEADGDVAELYFYAQSGQMVRTN